MSVLPAQTTAPPEGSRRRAPVPSLVAACLLVAVSLVLLAAGVGALWKDRVARDSSGFVTLGSSDMRTQSYAIVGDLRGDGPAWLWGSSVIGDTRVRVQSQAEQPLFIGIARKDDILQYLRGAGYATVDSFEVRADTTHDGGAPSGPPADESIWAASTQGTDRLTLTWTPRPGDWSVVFMNADARAAVDIHGDASATFPLLTWLAAGLLVAGGIAGLIGLWVLLSALRRWNRGIPVGPGRQTPDMTPGQINAPHDPAHTT